jgi:hypothetical protein
MNQLKKIEDSIASAKGRIARAAGAARLYDNPDFKRLIVEEYLRDQPIRMVNLYGSGSLLPEQKRELELDLHAVGALQTFLYRTFGDGELAESDLESAEYDLQIYLQEQQNGEETFVNPNHDARNLGA